MERVAGPVDDRLEQLVPRPRGRREARDLVQEPELLELLGAARGGAGARSAAGARGGTRPRSSWHHDTSVREGCRPEGCGTVAARARNGRARWPRVSRARARRRPPARRAAVAAEPRRRSARPAPAIRSRSRSGCSARCSARSSPSRPAPSCSTSSSGSGGRRSPSAATTTRSSGPARRRSSPRSTSDAAEVVIRAFSLYFRLVNLAEERERVRALRAPRAARRRGRRRSTTRSPTPIAAAASTGAGSATTRASTQLVGRLRITPGPDRPSDRGPPPDGPRSRSAGSTACSPGWTIRDLDAAEDRDVRRRLREEITLLWRTADLRPSAPTPARRGPDGLAFFDETLFTRRAAALPGRSTRRSTRPAAAERRARPPTTGRTGTRPPRVAAVPRWGRGSAATATATRR